MDTDMERVGDMSGKVLLPLTDWRAALSRPSGELIDAVAALRNEPKDAATAAVGWYAGLLDQAAKAFGHADSDSVAVFRAPGRVNLLGTHVDHRGGRVNPIAVREMASICFPREDGVIRLANADSSYGVQEFAIADLLPDGPVDNWPDWTLKTPEYLKAQGLLGNWSSYVRAAAAYFANAWGSPQAVKGFDLFVDTQLPRAAGLSSSSALVVTSAMALHLVNGREIDPKSLAEETGKAEWYVGTRGGSGDQAAITLSKANHVSHVDFFPMDVDWSPWVKGYSVLVCHSRVHAQKTSNARSIFNERVATYGIALMWVKHLHPEWAPKLEHLRDVLRIGLSVSQIYEMLKELPWRATREEILAALPKDTAEIEKLFLSHDDPDEGYRVRDVCLYGLAECTRSLQLSARLRAGDIEGAGELLDLSHEGDRVTCLDDSGHRQACDTGLTDEDLDGLIAALASGDDEMAAAADLAQQPGGYAASCPELDEMVDIARSVEGVLGAGLIGAGLGGCVEVLVADDAVERLKQVMLEEYYEPSGREPFMETMVPVQGAGPLEVA